MPIVKKPRFAVALVLMCACAVPFLLPDSPPVSGEDSREEAEAGERPDGSTPPRREQATFGAGCFWCTEAVFARLKGVESVVSGYSGGRTPNPTYRQVLTGRTGHAEVVQITYDPDVISYEELLEVFWKTHDPTTRNRQGPDVGTQYRSVVFYHDDEQRKLAEHYRDKLNESQVFSRPIVTQIAAFRAFHRAEPYHQRYFERNAAQPYCQMYIAPKVKKFEEVFREKLK